MRGYVACVARTRACGTLFWIACIVYPILSQWFVRCTTSDNTGNVNIVGCDTIYVFTETSKAMGRTVYAEQRLHNYLTSLAKPDEYTIGLIVGQVRFLYVPISRHLCSCHLSWHMYFLNHSLNQTLLNHFNKYKWYIFIEFLSKYIQFYLTYVHFRIVALDERLEYC